MINIQFLLASGVMVTFWGMSRGYWLQFCITEQQQQQQMLAADTLTTETVAITVTIGE